MTRAPLEFLVQLAGSHGDAMLRKYLDLYFGSRARETLDVAVQVGEPLASLLAEHLERRPDPHLAAELVGRIPEESSSLERLAVVCLRQALALPLAGGDRAGQDRRASFLHRLAHLLGRRNELAEAHDVATAAVSYYSSLGPLGDAQVAHRAAARLTLAEILSKREQAQLARLEAESAVADLAALYDRLPTLYAELYATSLWTLNALLVANVQHSAALTPSYHALRVARKRHQLYLRRDLSGEQREEERTFMELAEAHENYAELLAEAGRPDLALGHVQAAIRRYRELPVLDQALPLLALARAREGGYWFGVKFPLAAYAAYEEARDIYFELSELYPETFSERYSAALSNVSSAYLYAGQERAAYQHARRSAARYRRFYERDPSAHRTALASAELNYAHALSMLGRHSEARTRLQAARASLWLRRDRTRSQEETLAKVDAHLCHSYLDVDLYDRALRHGKAAVLRFDRLGVMPILEEHANAINVLSVTLRVLGRFEEALGTAARAYASYARLAENEPGFQANAAIAKHGKALVTAELGLWPEAKVLFQDVLDDLEQAASMDAFFGSYYEEALEDFNGYAERFGDPLSP